MQERSDKPATVSHHSVITRVLLVEDNIPDARMIREMLHDSEEGHFDLEVASRLSEAISLIREAPFDIVLLDLGLPDSQGLETLTAYLESAAEIPVIVLTGLADDAISMQAVASGAQDYLVKGRIDGPMLTRAIRYAISRKRQEGALRQSEERYRAVSHSAKDAIISADSEGNIVHWNRGAETIFGYSEAEVIGQPATLLIPSHFREEHLAGMARMRAGEEPHILGEVVEMEGVRKDGSEFPIEFSLAAWQVADRRYYTAIVRDIAERKRAEEEIRALAKFPSENPDPIMRIATDGTLLYINEIGSRHLSDWHLQAGKIVPPMLRDTVSRAMNHGSRQVFDLEHNESVYSFTVAPISGAGYANLYGRNITDRKRAEWALKESEEKFRIIFDSSKDGIILADVESKKIYTGNKTFCDMVQYTLDEIRQLCVADIHPEEDLPRLLDAFERGVRQESVLEGDIPVRRKDGSVFWTEVTASPVTISGKKYLLGNFRDITERKRSEEARTRLGMAVDQAAEGIVITDPEGRIEYVNPSFERITGYLQKEAVGQNIRILKSGKQDEMFYKNMWETISRGEVWKGHVINKKKDGTLYEVETVISPVRNASGKIINFVAGKRDITQDVILQKQLQAAQKMESVGTLAGGIAHDFNNVLTVIIGYGEMLKLRIANDPNAISDLDEVLRSAERAAMLTRQLLTFARRQVIDPTNLDLNEVTTGLVKLLRKITREDIEIKTFPAECPVMIRADCGQVEQVVMNLCLNARDAMPEGGQLVIETRVTLLEEGYLKQYPYMKAGRYAVLSVSDTGVGMDEKTQEHIFEPFFTTKGPEKGTGLGLAVVYGIVKQHNGFIHLYSEPGKGTTFRVYFPEVDAPADTKVIASQGVARGGSETILLAEDNESVRHLTEQTLASFGYKVLIACDGEEAVDIFRRHQKEIAMAVLDVVMPKKGGKQAYNEMITTIPGLKVLFLSGYSANAIHDSFVLLPGVPFLQKPFNPSALARKVREVLDGK